MCCCSLLAAGVALALSAVSLAGPEIPGTLKESDGKWAVPVVGAGPLQIAQGAQRADLPRPAARPAATPAPPHEGPVPTRPCDVGWIDNRSGYARGTWIHGDVDEVMRQRAATCTGHGYACGAHPRLLRSMSWKWSPNGCVLRPFDSDEFTRLLAGRTLWFLGDSISMCMASSLKCLGVRNSAHRYDHLGLGINQNELTPISDLLGKDVVKALDLRTKWRKVIEHLGIKPHDIIIFNTGARLSQVAQDLALRYGELAKVMSDLHPGLLFYRLTVFGHNNCQLYDGPLESVSADQYKSFTENMYNWGSFRTYNEQMIQAFQAVAADRFHVLDVSMFELRPDGHIGQVYSDISNSTDLSFLPERARTEDLMKYKKNDCLHYCVPGPVDTWNYLLYHHLAPLLGEGLAASGEINKEDPKTAQLGSKH